MSFCVENKIQNESVECCMQQYDVIDISDVSTLGPLLGFECLVLLHREQISLLVKSI